MPGQQSAADERRAREASRRPRLPGGRWSQLRRHPCRPRGQAPTGGDSPFGLSAELTSGKRSAVALHVLVQMWSASAPVGKGGGPGR
jgi:hypothetical protein